MSSKWIREYFIFTQKERIAILVLLAVIATVFLLPDLFPPKHGIPDQKQIDSFKTLARSLNEIPGDSIDDEEASFKVDPPTDIAMRGGRLFYFDPNTTASNEWEQLGVKRKTIQTIQHYLSKGGQFRKADDLKKIYGLTSQDFLRLRPYIRIVSSSQLPHVFVNRSDSGNPGRPINNTEGISRFRETPIIEINSTDTTALIRLPGIGSKLANRIINFRDKLGGFYSIEQVAETYALPDSTFQKIRSFLILGNKPLVRININEADAVRLKQHPYISWAIANAIVEYRQQHGRFNEVGELERITVILPEQLKRLIPYLNTY